MDNSSPRRGAEYGFGDDEGRGRHATTMGHCIRGRCPCVSRRRAVRVLIESVVSGGRAVHLAASELARVAAAACIVAAQGTRVAATHTRTVAIVAAAIIGRGS